MRDFDKKQGFSCFLGSDDEDNVKRHLCVMCAKASSV